MKADITTTSGKKIMVDLSKPIDLSLPLGGENPVSAFYIPPVDRKPFQAGSFIGDVKQGGSCNVFTITFNPHGNGTHTETAGHILAEEYPVNDHLKQFFFLARLISIQPEKIGEDLVITKDLITKKLPSFEGEALIIRTLPNSPEKKSRKYSGTNPAYVEPDAAELLASMGIKHLVLDVPSIDREDDGGKLSAHHLFWNTQGKLRSDSTITEMAYVPDEVEDGEYLLNLMIAPFVNDASPSKPVIYKSV
jgi:kynurenine formamidase